MDLQLTRRGGCSFSPLVEVSARKHHAKDGTPWLLEAMPTALLPAGITSGLSQADASIQLKSLHSETQPGKSYRSL